MPKQSVFKSKMQKTVCKQTNKQKNSKKKQCKCMATVHSAVLSMHVKFSVGN